jgi:hypothetical protein
VILGRENETALEIDTAAPLTPNLPKTERQRKLRNLKNLAMEIKNICKLNTLSTCP